MLKAGMGLIALILASPSYAEVQSSGPHGFALETTLVVPAAPAETYAALGRIGEWGNPGHSYSGDAANMTLELRAGGCFCETIPADGATVEHMRVVYARPGRALRLHGGLGPLQAEGVAGALTWELKPVPGGTEVTQTYVVGGHIRGGAEAYAAPVDHVLSEQLSRLRDYLGR